MADLKSTDERLRELALFAGAGGGILGGKLLGWRTVCAVEYEPYAAGILVQRQNDKIFEPFPIWDDVCTFDGKPWRGIVDVVSGGFPCQDISSMGKRAGINGKQSGLWKQMVRVVSEVRPAFVFVENSPDLTVRGLGTVLGDLVELGFDIAWCILSAADFGAPHLRKRIWIVARHPYQGNEIAKQIIQARCSKSSGICAEPSGWWSNESRVDRVANGVAHRIHRFAAIGNGQVARVAAAAFMLLASNLNENN